MKQDDLQKKAEAVEMTEKQITQQSPEIAQQIERMMREELTVAKVQPTNRELPRVDSSDEEKMSV